MLKINRKEFLSRAGIWGVVLLSLISVGADAKYFTPLDGRGVEITRFFTHDGGGVTLYISGPVQNLDECPVTERMHLKGNLEGHQNMVAAALMAYASGRKVGFHAGGCEIIPFWGAGGGAVPIIDNLWVF